MQRLWTLACLVAGLGCAARPAAPAVEPGASLDTSAPATGPAPTPAAAEVEPPRADAVTPEVTEPKLPPPTATGVHALSNEQRKLLWETPEDPPAVTRGGVTKKLVDKQYLAGNEKTLYAFKPKIENLGGGYVGVGSDQAYFFLGWARPEFAWLVDYDADVVAIHAVYRAFLEAAGGPDAFMALWTKDGRKDSAKLIVAEGDPARTKELRSLYLNHRGWIERRLLAQRKRMTRAEVKSWITDAETYAFVRDLVMADRVRPMLANLLEPGAIRGVAASAKALGVPVRMLYLSNAEEYWKAYPPAFRESVAALPHDEKSLVARTLLIWDVNQDYRYNTQTIANFREWLEEPWIRNVYDIAHSRGEPSATEINQFESGGSPADSPRARAVQKSSR